MMKVIGEEGTSLKDYIDYLKGELFDSVYLQQNAFDAIDEATSGERQVYVFNFIYDLLESDFDLEDKEKALHFFQKLRQLMRTWNSCVWESAEFKKTEEEVSLLLEEKRAGAG
jgi:V/A-type H+-transporting ATPase subunit A